MDAFPTHMPHAADRIGKSPANSGDLAALIEARLASLTPLEIEIIDESHRHAGHAGNRGGARHYRVKLRAECFTGLSPVARHRLVYDRLQDLIPHLIHALALDLQAPSSQEGNS